MFRQAWLGPDCVVDSVVQCGAEREPDEEPRTALHNDVACAHYIILRASACFTDDGAASASSPPRLSPPPAACLHLTDFAANSVPAVPVLAPTDLVAVSPKDLTRKLRVLLIVCFGLFGLMNVLAGLVNALDARDRAKRFRQLCAKFGHVTHPNGAWTWRFGQDERFTKGEALGCVTGGVVDLCRELGIPYIRLRMALPEELFKGGIAHAIGRERDIAPRTLKEAQPEEQAKVLRLLDAEAERAARQGRTLAIARRLLEAEKQPSKAALRPQGGALLASAPSSRRPGMVGSTASRRGISFASELANSSEAGASTRGGTAGGSVRPASRGNKAADSLGQAVEAILRAQRMAAAGDDDGVAVAEAAPPKHGKSLFRAKVHSVIRAKRSEADRAGGGSGDAAPPPPAEGTAAAGEDASSRAPTPGSVSTATTPRLADPSGRRYTPRKMAEKAPSRRSGTGGLQSQSSVPSLAVAVTAAASAAGANDADGTAETPGRSSVASPGKLPPAPGRRPSKLPAAGGSSLRLPSDRGTSDGAAAAAGSAADLAALAAAAAAAGGPRAPLRKPSLSAGRLVGRVGSASDVDIGADSPGPASPAPKAPLRKPSLSGGRLGHARSVGPASSEDIARMAANMHPLLEVTAADVLRSAAAARGAAGGAAAASVKSAVSNAGTAATAAAASVKSASTAGSGWRLLRAQTLAFKEQQRKQRALQRHGADPSGRDASISRRAKSGTSYSKTLAAMGTLDEDAEHQYHAGEGTSDGGGSGASALMRVRSTPHMAGSKNGGALSALLSGESDLDDEDSVFSIEQMTGTALIFAWLNIAGLGSLEVIAQRQRLTAMLYNEYCVLSHDFDDLVEKMKARRAE